MTYTRCNLFVKPDLHPAAFKNYAGCRMLDGMAEHRIYLREWRKKTDLTQKQVVERLSYYDDPLLPQTEASLSRLETRKQPYSQRILEALADIYDCEPHELLGRNPLIDSQVIDMVARLDGRRQAQIAAFIQTLESPAFNDDAEELHRVADKRTDFAGPDNPRPTGGTSRTRRRLKGN